MSIMLFQIRTHPYENKSSDGQFSSTNKKPSKVVQKSFERGLGDLCNILSQIRIPMIS